MSLIKVILSGIGAVASISYFLKKGKDSDCETVLLSKIRDSVGALLVKTNMPIDCLSTIFQDSNCCDIPVPKDIQLIVCHFKYESSDIVEMISVMVYTESDGVNKTQKNILSSTKIGFDFIPVSLSRALIKSNNNLTLKIYDKKDGKI